jgi:hypothetical protein
VVLFFSCAGGVTERTHIAAQEIKMEQAKIEPTARRLVEPIKLSFLFSSDYRVLCAAYSRAIGILTAAQRIVNRYYAQRSRLVAA